jgi:hypothetical protein
MKSSVALVLDRYFGRRVEELARRMPVWVISSTDNHQAVAAARSRLNDAANITEFVAFDGEDLGSMCARLLYEIDEHHGTASSMRPYEQLLIYGVEAGLVAPDVMHDLGIEEACSVSGALCFKKQTRQKTAT